jgi:hypothetical protein
MPTGPLGQALEKVFLKYRFAVQQKKHEKNTELLIGQGFKDVKIDCGITV